MARRSEFRMPIYPPVCSQALSIDRIRLGSMADPGITLGLLCTVICEAIKIELLYPFLEGAKRLCVGVEVPPDRWAI